MRELVTRLVVLAAVASVSPVYALALECDVSDAETCSSINSGSHCQGLGRPGGSDQVAFVRTVKGDPIAQGCNADFRSARCGAATDPIRQGGSDIKQWAVSSLVSLDTRQLPGSDNVRHAYPGRLAAHIYGNDTAGVPDTWANMVYRLGRDIGPNNIWFALPDLLFAPFHEIQLFSFPATQLADSGHGEETRRPSSDAIPEPSGLATLIAGLFGMYAVARRRISSI